MAARHTLIVLLLLGACAGPKIKPAARQHTLTFEGSREVSEVRLREAIEEDLAAFEGRGDKPAVDDAAWTLERFLRGRGFPFAEVNYEYDRDAGGAAQALLRIEEGPRTHLAAVAFEGVENLDSEELRASFGQSRSLLGDKRWYVERDIRSKIEAVERFYRRQGFLDVVIQEPRVLFSEDRATASMTITVEEGLRSYLREVELAGASQTFLPELEAAVAISLQQPFSPRTPHELSLRLKSIYTHAAHPDVQLEYEVVRDETSGDTVILIRVEEGPEVTIEAVKVSGNTRTSEAFVRSRVPLKTGDLYDAEAVSTSFRELYKSHLFRRVDVRLEGSGARRDLIVELEELPAVEVWVEPGWGSYEKARVSGGIRDRNIFGTGRSLALEGTAAVLAQELTLSLTDPWFLESKYALTYSLFGNRREETSFISNELGAGLNLSRHWTPIWSSSLGYQYRLTRIESDDFSFIPPSFVDDVDISSFILTTARDTRDEIFVPSTGSLSRVSLEWGAPSIGSELDFVRMWYTQSNFWSLTQSTIAGFSIRGGLIEPLNDSRVVPLQERFFNGGENTVRSFGEDELGPRPGGKPVGGEAYSVLTTELRQRLFGHFDGAAFMDAGNLAGRAEDAFDFRDLRYAVGFGVRYLLPIGPLRLDFAWNPHPRATEDDFRIHFSVGMSF